jgi:hypothetical protein
MRRPSPATVIALAALFVALGGPARAARLIDGGDIRPGTVGSQQVKDRALKPRDLSGSAVRALRRTPKASITEHELGTNSVTTRVLAPGSVLTGTVGDDSLTAADLASSSVTNQEVADNAIAQAEIRNNGVGATELADQAVGSGELIDGSARARDIGRFWGELNVDFAGLAGGECQGALATNTPADVANADIGDDLVVLEAGLGWPVKLTYGAAAAADRDKFIVYACNPTDDPTPLNPPVIVFRYVIVGF